MSLLWCVHCIGERPPLQTGAHDANSLLDACLAGVSIHKLSHGAPVNRGWLRLFKPAGDEEGGCIELQTTFRPSSIAPQWIKVSDPASGPVPPSSIVINGTECRNTDGSLFCLARGCATREEGMQIGFASMASPNMQYGFACIRREMSTYEVMPNMACGLHGFGSPSHAWLHHVAFHSMCTVMCNREGLGSAWSDSLWSSLWIPFERRLFESWQWPAIIA